jgi:DNA-binding NarL/FixJ family response regulator
MYGESAVGVVILDPYPVTRVGIRCILNCERHFEVVADTADREEFLAAARLHCPALAIIDHGSPNQLLLTICSELKSLDPAPAVLVFSSDLSDRTILAYRLYGVDSYLTKATSPETLCEVARGTAQGSQIWVLGQQSGAHANDRDENLGELTQREREILSFLLDRRTNQQIATALHISPNTVKNHVQAVLRKLGLHRRTDLSQDPHSYLYSYVYTYSLDRNEPGGPRGRLLP